MQAAAAPSPQRYRTEFFGDCRCAGSIRATSTESSRTCSHYSIGRMSGPAGPWCPTGVVQSDESSSTFTDNGSLFPMAELEGPLFFRAHKTAGAVPVAVPPDCMSRRARDGRSIGGRVQAAPVRRAAGLTPVRRKAASNAKQNGVDAAARLGHLKFEILGTPKCAFPPLIVESS